MGFDSKELIHHVMSPVRREEQGMARQPGNSSMIVACHTHTMDP